MTSSLLAEIRWSVFMSKSHRSLCVSLSRTGAGLCIYHLLVWSNLYFLHISQWINLSTQLCLVLYSFCANLLHSLMWLMVSSLTPHSLHLLFFASYIFSIWYHWFLWRCFVLLLREILFLSKSLLLSQIQILSCEMLFIRLLKRLYSCFSSHFCIIVIGILLSIVLSVSFPMAVIGPCSCFSM